MHIAYRLISKGYVEKKKSPRQLAHRVRRLIRPTNVQIKAATPNMRITRDVHIPMGDGSYLSANLYRPTGPGRFPVLLCLRPARKDQYLRAVVRPWSPYLWPRGHGCTHRSGNPAGAPAG